MIAVLGAGAMGTALATHLARNGQDVTVFATDHDAVALQAWRDRRPHPALGVVPAPDVSIRELAGSGADLGRANMITVAVASPGLVPTISLAARHAAPDAVWLLATKGWQEHTLMSPSEVAASILGDDVRIVTLAGPGLASEIVAGSPTALLCASRNATARRHAARTLTSTSMLVVTTSDVVGAETSAAYKNVVAIAVGIAEGLSKRFIESALVRAFANARAAMFAQGVMDMVRLAQAKGGRATTVLGLAGAGDLYVTCVGGRNGRFGQLLGSGATMEQALQAINSTVEGVANTHAALGLAERHAIDLPTARAVDLALSQRFTDDQGMEQIRQVFTATLWPQYAFSGSPAGGR